MRTDVNREPKGSANGGQFAPKINAESTVDLTGPARLMPEGDDLTNVEVDGVVIANFRHLDINDKTESLNAGNMCISCGRGSGFVNRVPGSETTDDGITVEGYVCAECSNCTDGQVAAWCSGCKEFTMGYTDPSECGQCGEAQDTSIPIPEGDEPEESCCTQCTGETSFDFEVFAHGLRGDTLMTKVGNNYGELKIGEWGEHVFPETLVQVSTIEAETPDDSEGWSAQSLAQILKERGIATAKVTDVLDIFNDGGDVVSIAFDPKRGINQTMLEINSTLKGLT